MYMNVNSSNISYSYQPSFSSCSRVYKSGDASIRGFVMDNVYTTTGPFREHINWRDFLGDSIEHFKDKPKVNIYSLGCSDGSEALSYAILLADMLPETELKKYFPIIAYDIDPEVIDAAKTGRINLDSSDFRTIAKHTLNVGRNAEGIFTGENLLIRTGRPVRIDNDLNQDEDSHSIFNPLYSYVPIGPIANSVQYGVMDLRGAVKNINDNGNSIVNISHVLGYCNDNYIDEVTQALGNKLIKGSRYVFDKMHNTPEYWQKLKSLEFYAPFGKDYCIAEKL